MTFGKYLNKKRTVKKASATMWLLKIIYSVGQVNFRLVFNRTKKKIKQDLHLWLDHIQDTKP